MRREYNPSDVVHCPHCGNTDNDDNALEFVVPNRVGPSSRATTQCSWCEGKFDAVFDGKKVIVTWESDT